MRKHGILGENAIEKKQLKSIMSWFITKLRHGQSICSVPTGSGTPQSSNFFESKFPLWKIGCNFSPSIFKKTLDVRFKAQGLYQGHVQWLHSAGWMDLQMLNRERCLIDMSTEIYSIRETESQLLGQGSRFRFQECIGHTICFWSNSVVFPR